MLLMIKNTVERQTREVMQTKISQCQYEQKTKIVQHVNNVHSTESRIYKCLLSTEKLMFFFKSAYLKINSPVP